MRVLPCGPDALLLEFADGAEVARYAAGLARAPIPGVVETVPAARTLLLRVPDPRALSRVATQAREVEPAEPVAGAERHVEIPVRYDGEDLGAVAAHLGLDAAEVVARHTGATWTVAFC